MPSRSFFCVLAGCAALALSCSSESSSTGEARVTAPGPREVEAPAAAEPAGPADDPVPQGEPLPATEPGAWSWIGGEQFGDVPRCMDGSRTGLGINRAPGDAKGVMLFMQGGGACFDGQTCALADRVLSADHHDAQDFAAWAASQGQANVMNRRREDNPFRDWDFVMLPYCSGDVFAGDTAHGFQGRPQQGHRNVAAYLPRLVSTFRDAGALVLTGMSAGGYGAAYDFVQVQEAFPWLDVTMIDDSGPTLATKFSPSCLQQKWKETWGMEKTSPVEGPFPLGFDAASGVAGPGLRALFQQVVTAHPKSKFAFISHAHDLVMRYFHGIGHSASCAGPYLLSAGFFEEGLRDIRALEGDNFSTFYGPGVGHPYFYDDAEMYETKVDGITLAEWLRRLVTTRDEPRRIPAQF